MERQMPNIPPEERYNHRDAAEKISFASARTLAKRLIPQKDVQDILRLSGGFNNANFLLDYGTDKFVLRLFSGGSEIAEREVAVLGMARKAGIKVPKVIDFAVDSPEPGALLEFVSGTLLSKVLESRDLDISIVFSSVGEELGRIHSLRFPKAGTFSNDGGVREFGDFCDAGLKYLHDFLNGRAGERLGPRLTEALLSLVNKDWHLVRDNFRGAALVHCDFNPKNILIRDGKVAGVLDWEFSIAGDPLIDLGNFFRFIDDYTDKEREMFLNSYVMAGGSLPTNWKKTARLHDLISMCAFLSEKEEMPASFRTARMVIEETIGD
jgi:aminoglycoside phosphotransferase (APT) family kinase protein